MEDRHIIWSNENLDLDDWREDLQEQYPDCSEDELYRIMCETNADYLSDERVNLNIQLSQPILVIADLGLWNGRRMGYKEIPSGNIRDCLSGGYDYTTWYVTRRATSVVMTFTMMASTTISTGFTRTEFPNIKRTG